MRSRPILATSATLLGIAEISRGVKKNCCSSVNCVLPQRFASPCNAGQLGTGMLPRRYLGNIGRDVYLAPLARSLAGFSSSLQCDGGGGGAPLGHSDSVFPSQHQGFPHMCRRGTVGEGGEHLSWVGNLLSPPPLQENP